MTGWRGRRPRAGSKAMAETMADDLKARFTAIVGAANALSGADAAAHDEEPRGRWTGRAGLVLRPASTAEAAAILRLADETRTPIVPQGGNTGLVGGQTADMDGRQVVLSLARMNRIRELDPQSATLTVEAGVILSEAKIAADRAGLMFPLSLASEGSCQIGGNLATNAGGVAALSHGVARDLCLGLEVVLPGGAVLDDLRKLKKDNTGYDLKNLFIGSEGTLGVITAAVLRLLPKPAGRAVAWVGLSAPARALALFRQASAACGTALVSFELIGDRPLRFALRHVPGLVAPLAGAHAWHVLMQIDSLTSAHDAAMTMERVLANALEDGLVDDAAIAAGEPQAERLWRIRETIPGAQKFEGASIKHDIAVPIAAIPEFIATADAAVQRAAPGARIVCFGHMGDGNLHYNIARPHGIADTDFLRNEEAVHAAVHAVVRGLGGSISAEHGIGRMKRDELARTAPAVALDLMRRVKHAFDPNGIMNPGKLL